jgi:hypothetical protein
MIKNENLKYSYGILLMFVILEVFFFNSDSLLRYLITVLEYFFISYALVKNQEIGLMYFISFSILTVGIGNYADMDNLPNNFWGIRSFGFSLNILFSFAIFIFILIKRKLKFSFKVNDSSFFFLFLFYYSLIIGVISYTFSINYNDNFLSDLMTYAPSIIYLFIISNIKINSAIKIMKYSISLTIILILLSFLFNIKSTYGNDYFTLSNSLNFILPICLFTFRNLYSKFQIIVLSSLLILMILLKEYILGGKTIIMFSLFLIWIFYHYKNLRAPMFIMGVAIVFFIDIITSSLLGFFSGTVMDFKFSQIFDVFKIANINILASTYSSMGNLIAEGVTIYYHLIENPLYLIFGKGFGGGTPDVFGYLSPWAGTSGYNSIDAVRDNYYKMHLPIYEVFLKSGIFGTILFIRLLIKNFISKNKYSILFFFQLGLMFYVSKEFFLVTILLLKIVNNASPEEIYIKN